MTTEAGRALLDLLHALSPGGHYSVWLTAIEAEAAAAERARILATLDEALRPHLAPKPRRVVLDRVLAILDEPPA